MRRISLPIAQLFMIAIEETPLRNAGNLTRDVTKISLNTPHLEFLNKIDMRNIGLTPLEYYKGVIQV